MSAKAKVAVVLLALTLLLGGGMSFAASDADAHTGWHYWGNSCINGHQVTVYKWLEYSGYTGYHREAYYASGYQWFYDYHNYYRWC